MLVGIGPRGRYFIAVIGRHPQVFGHEPRALDYAGLRMSEWQNVLPWHQLVAHRLTQRVIGRRIGNYPIPPAHRIDNALRFMLGPQQGFLCIESVTVGVVRTRRLGDGIHLVHRVILAVHAHVHSKIEEMLVDVRVQLRRDDCAVLRIFAHVNGGGVDDAGQLDLHLDRAVLVEIPEEPVLIVAHRGDAGNHQTPRPPHFSLANAPIGVFPKDPVVLLVHAHRVGNREWLPPSGVHHRVEVVNLAQAVAPEGQRVGQRTDAVLARVECVLPVVVLARVTVRHHHVRQRGPVQYRPHAPLVFVSNGVDHQPFPGREPHPQMPLLPHHAPAIHGETRPVRLRDLQRLQIVAEPLHELGAVVAVIRRQRDQAVVVDPNYLHAVEVHHRGHALDGSRIPVVGGTRAHKVAAQHQSSPFLILEPVVACRPGVHHHQAGVGDAALLDGSLEPGIRLHRSFALHELVKHHPGLHAGNVLPRNQPLIIKRDHRLVRSGSVIVQHHQEGLTRDRIARPKAPHDLLLRFPQDHRLKPCPGTQVTHLLQNRCRFPNFPTGERI